MPVTHRLAQDAKSYSPGLVYVEFSAQLNGTSSPLAANFRGDGVASFVRTGTGTFTLTLLDSLREVISAYPDLEANGGGDGSYATMTAPSNEGQPSGGSPISFTVFTHVSGGTLTDFTARRVKITICMKQTSLGK